MARRWIWGGLILAGLAVGGVLSLPALIEWQALRLLAAAGFPSAKVRVDRLDSSVAVLHVVLDEKADQRIGWIAVDYSLGGLKRLRFDKLEISDTRLHVGRDGGLAGQRPAGSDSPGAALESGLPSLPFDRIILHKAILFVDTADGPVKIPIGLEYQGGEGHHEVDAVAVGFMDLNAEVTPLPDGVQKIVARLTADKAGITMDLSGKLTGDFSERIEFKGTLSDASRTLKAALAGNHDFTAGTGRIDAKLAPVTFGPETPPIATLLPFTRDWITALTGTVAMDGGFAWGPGAKPGRASVLLKDVAVEAGSVTAEGINAVLSADRLAPLRLPGTQVISVGLMDVGMPLTDGEIRFGIDRGTLSVQQAEWQWAGGIVRAAPFKTAMAEEDRTIVLEAEGVDLQKILAVAAIDGLAASGTLHGKLPVRIAGATVSIADGKLEATGPGILRYDPAEPPAFLSGDPGSSTDLLVRALTDFHYETLALAVNGTAGSTLAVSFAVRGANPGFYDGYPVALNLNVSGALDTILRRGISTYRIPDAVRERMMDFQNQGQ